MNENEIPAVYLRVMTLAFAALVLLIALSATSLFITLFLATSLPGSGATGALNIAVTADILAVLLCVIAIVPAKRSVEYDLQWRATGEPAYANRRERSENKAGLLGGLACTAFLAGLTFSAYFVLTSL